MEKNSLKKFIALARVSTEEQAREGFSLDVQEQALNAWAQRSGGEIVKMYKIAETASKSDERKAFQEILSYVRKNSKSLSGMLFYKVDRAARNQKDFYELEVVEQDYGVPFIAITQQTENTPAGRMQRRILANLASYYTEQLSKDTMEGMARRAQAGYFVGRAPYGYQNLRDRQGRGIIETHPENAKKVRLIYELYAFEDYPLQDLAIELKSRGIPYTEASAHWDRSLLHRVLKDRSYIGEVFYRGVWYPGQHEPIIPKPIWLAAQVKMGKKARRTKNDLTYGGALIQCGLCPGRLVGEKITKKNGKEYVYYRCSRYLEVGHPRHRWTEEQIDVMALQELAKMRFDDEELKEWFLDTLRLTVEGERTDREAERSNLLRQRENIRGQQDRLLNLRLSAEVDEATYKRKSGELRKRADELDVAFTVLEAERTEAQDLALKAFELSQDVVNTYTYAKPLQKRYLLQFFHSNLKMIDVSLVVERRKPWDDFAAGLLLEDGSPSGTLIETTLSS